MVPRIRLYSTRYFLHTFSIPTLSRPKRPTKDDRQPTLLYPSPSRSCLRLVICSFGSGCTARRGLRVPRSCIHLYLFVSSTEFCVGGVHARTDHRRKFPFFMSLVILDFTAASYSGVWVCSRHVEAIAICAIRPCVTLFWFYTSNLSTHETREDSVISSSLPMTGQWYSADLFLFTVSTSSTDAAIFALHPKCT